MKERFEGSDAHQKLVQELLRQEILVGDMQIAESLAKQGSLREFVDGELLIRQNDSDNDVFFILSGVVDVFVNNHHVATRKAGSVVGEMAVVSTLERRSATVQAKGEVLALVVSAREFEQAGSDKPDFWRNLARLAGDRLRERAKYHLPANEEPIVFVGSSAEQLDIVDEITTGLKHEDVDFKPWCNKGIFSPSGEAINSLMEVLRNADFAIFVFGEDDRIASRGEESYAPRDNVIFELGMFIARLGRDRVFFIYEHNQKLKIPSDLIGVTPITYRLGANKDLTSAMSSVCAELKNEFRTKGVHRKRMHVE